MPRFLRIHFQPPCRSLLTRSFMQSNIATLTQSSKVSAAKRRAKRNEVKEVLFDDEVRRYATPWSWKPGLRLNVCREFLTGFHKRKKAKADAARQRAKEREKQEKLEERREVCSAWLIEHIIVSLALGRSGRS